MIPRDPIEWRISDREVPYPTAVVFMEARVEEIAAGHAPELVWLLEHPPIYTAGTSAKQADLLDPRFPVFKSGRGGQYTYHGPGQRVGYVLMNLKKRGGDVRAYVHGLEEWVIRALASFNLTTVRREGRVGLWVARNDRVDDKIAAIGVRVRKGISFHGVSINLDPDLSHFSGIVPCGIADHGVTSLVALGYPVTMADLDVALRNAFEEVFGTVAGRR
ncbi:MAG: lipoyl(octanoyl) transferase LipB [Alphaproteobacteria bacterium]|nr:lipoyl(octanoyl) transferase LipB [Alphaproteobacteria bacterium]